MKWCVWSGGSLVWLAVIMTIPHVSYQECPDGEVRVRGINTDGFKAGFIDICDDDDNRRPLCGDGFDANAAIVICAELEFPMAALHCTDSCLGSRRRDKNIQLSCTGRDIQDCTMTFSSTCASYAGVICCRNSDTCPPFLPSPSDPTPPCDCPSPPPSPSCDCATCEGPDMVTTPTQCADICDSCPPVTSPTCPPATPPTCPPATPPTCSPAPPPTCSPAPPPTCPPATPPTCPPAPPPTCPPATPPTCNCTISTGAEPETTPPQCATVGTAGGNGSGDSTDPTVGGGSGGVGGVAGGSTDLSTALGGGLGVLSAVLAILLVGVVLGWVWSCHRRKGKSGIHERSPAGQIDLTNPTYSSTSPHPSIQYSSLGPRDKPRNHATPMSHATPSSDTYAVVNKAHAPIPPGGEGDRIYHVLEAPGEGGVADYADLDEKEGGGRRGGGADL